MKTLRSNPKEFLTNCTDKELLSLFPISQKTINKCYKGNVSKYRSKLLTELRVGSLVIN